MQKYSSIDKEKLIIKILNVLPNFLSIRRKPYNTVGGKIILSFINEINDFEIFFNKSIDKYFVNKYSDPDSVPYIANRILVGDHDYDDIEILDHGIAIVKSYEDFNINNAYYNNGYLYFHSDSDILNGITIRIINTNRYFSKSNIEVGFRIWNIFDEISLFLDVDERMDNESNLSLRNRILNRHKTIVNNTSVGIKNAIANVILTDSHREIVKSINISKLNKDNILKSDKNGDTIYNNISSVNRDLMSYKRWDVDLWNFSFKEIDYISNTWDSAIRNIDNGIGRNNDLKVYSSSDIDSDNDLCVSIFKRDSDKVYDKIKNSEFSVPIKLSFINPMIQHGNYEHTIAKFSVTAKKCADLLRQNISIDCYNNGIVVKTIRFDDIIKTKYGETFDYKILSTFDFDGMIKQDTDGSYSKVVINKSDMDIQADIDYYKINFLHSMEFDTVFVNSSNTIVSNTISDFSSFYFKIKSSEQYKMIAVRDKTLFKERTFNEICSESENNGFFKTEDLFPRVDINNINDNEYIFVEIESYNDDISIFYKDKKHTNNINNNKSYAIAYTSDLSNPKFFNEDLLVCYIDSSSKNIENSICEIDYTMKRIGTDIGYSFKFNREDIKNISKIIGFFDGDDDYDSMPDEDLQYMISMFFIEVDNEKYKINKFASSEISPDIYITAYTDFIIAKENESITEEIENAINYLNRKVFTEDTHNSNSCFIMLESKNIKDILVISDTSKLSSECILTEKIDYTIDKNLGIIEIINKNVNVDSLFIAYTSYTILSISMRESFIMNMVENNIDVFDFVMEKSFSIKNNLNVNMKKYIDDYSNDKYVSISDTPWFNIIKSGESNIIINKDNSERLYIKSGYYYKDGKEFYMFSNKFTDRCNKNSSYDMFENSFLSDGIATLNEETSNLIKNSSFDNSNSSNLQITAHVDLLNKHREKINGISEANILTACNNFNRWNSLCSDLSLVDSYNSIGISFSSNTNLQNYIYAEITDLLAVGQHNSISFYGKNIRPYIGEGNSCGYDSAFVNSGQIIDIDSSNRVFEKSNNIYYKDFYVTEGTRYYLVLLGSTDNSISSEIDDIIILPNIVDDNNVLKIHIKDTWMYDNIISNKANDISRIKLLDNQTIIPGEKMAIMNSDGYINNGTSISWGLTKIFDINSSSNFISTKRVEINDDVIRTYDDIGEIEVSPLYIGNPSVINSLLITTNNVSCSSTNIKKMYLMVSDSSNGTFTLVETSTNNYIKVDSSKLLKYIKIKVVLNDNSVVNNISVYSEYKSSDGLSPILTYNTDSVFVSKIYDMESIKNYKIKNISIEDGHDAKIYVRTTKKNRYWTSWANIDINDNNSNSRIMNHCQFLQFMVQLHKKKVKINYIDIEVNNE